MASPTGTLRVPPRTIIIIVVAAVAVLSGVVAAAVLLGGSEKEKAAPTTTAVATTTTAIVTTTQPATGPVAPLTGLRVVDPALVNRPALAVKIDNLDAPKESALPQAGLARADVVFEEIVEGNITRLVAVFHSKAPGKVGPVRSARTTDVHLLPQFGRILLAWSGGNDGVVAAVRKSPFLVDLGHDAASGSYSRDRSRRAPHNLFVEADELFAKAPEGMGPPPPLFRYRNEGQAQPPTAEAAQGVDLVWGGGTASSPVSWRWDQKLGLYIRSQNGRVQVDTDGTVYSAPNVVVMVIPYGRSAADSRSPEAQTVGVGELFVYTHGKVIPGLWNRPSEDKPATLYDKAGKEILLTPGTTWVELPRMGGVTTIR